MGLNLGLNLIGQKIGVCGMGLNLGLNLIGQKIGVCGIEFGIDFDWMKK